ncbi:MAG: relaxase/mobilization nuclease domain-containing protein [Lachnospiraceae bacterium]|jgi:hypothetical protein|uniref:relaxase/mobilization nuclease domain-containing protein n=1 Tax=Methanobrevibacter sp. TaxID=66852 RepID=UPI0038695153|nr:relaxase/mobilization nuclease domain-containing protein [Lachnospiraceae bacterium]MBQ5907645.1 relaxase/mobilization nuclease domain-containing protein [Treponema sp.]MBR3600725.1 relaxase/mobilization nuclease domain-containing protein [Lachnospiraceae bacterium]MBR6581980.1 relaxase/mobilization nuclease domain-containing protein [Treponema sp.]
MAILKIVNRRNGKRKRSHLAGVIKYVLKTEKTEEKLIYGQNLEPERAYQMMMETKDLFNKRKGMDYFHFVLSYPPNEKITPEQALEQAKELLERTKKFRGYETLVAVHRDKKHIHVHFIVNSVNFVDGRKFHLSRKELEALKQLQNQINIEKGFSAAPGKYEDMNGEERTETVSNNKNTYQLLKRAESGEVKSYVQTCAISVLTQAARASSKEEFIQLMDQDGFETIWDDKKKHITFIDKERAAAGEQKCKIRLSKLADYYAEFKNLNTKEDLINGFDENRRVSAEARANIERIRSGSGIAADNNGSEIEDIGPGIEELKSSTENQRTEFDNLRQGQDNLRAKGVDQSAAIGQLEHDRKQREATRSEQGRTNNTTTRSSEKDYGPSR